MHPIDSKLCRMILTSRMILSEDQQKLVCEGDLKNFMDHCPEWLNVKDDNTKNWMDLDNKMTENVALCRAIAAKYFLMPDDPDQFKKCEEVEKILFSIMNTMCYLINKICFAPNNPVGNDFDPEYARSRFLSKFEQRLPALQELIVGPFIMGDSLPVYADYLLYACLYDLRAFVPQVFGTGKYQKIDEFMDKFWAYPSPVRRWFKSNDSKVGEYIRPPVPNIFELLPEDLLQGDL